MKIKEITNRYEFGRLVNFGNRAVLTLDLAKDKDEYGYKGQKVRVPDEYSEYGTMYSNCELRWYSDEKKIELVQGGSFLSSSFTYNDAMEDVEYAKAPIVDTGDTVILVIHNSETKELRAYKVEVADIKHNHCIQVLQITDKIDLPWNN